MRPRELLTQLARLQQACEVSSDRAWLAMREAARQVARCKVVRQTLRDAEADIIAGWTAALNHPAPSPQFLLLWQRELTECTVRIASAQSELTLATERLDEARTNWRLAHEKTDIVQSRRADARKRHRAERDEQVLAQIEDLHLYRSLVA